MADSSGKWRISAESVIRGRMRNRDHITVWTFSPQDAGGASLSGKGRADVAGDSGVGSLMCDRSGLWCGVWLPVSLLCFPCYLVSCLPPYFPIIALSRRVHREHLAAGGSLASVPRRSLALVPFCKLCTPVTGQHSRDWPRRSVLNSVSEKTIGGWGSCTFFLFLFGLRQLLSNYWAPCALNHATGLFSELVIQSLNHTDPPFYPLSDVFINLLPVPETAKVIP